MDTKARKGYVLALLTAVLTLNFVDRGLVMLLLEPIKQDLHLSDTQLGFITGIAFGLFYATLGLPMARWSDRGNRVTITAIAIGLWGLTVSSCLFVVTFPQLVCARIAAAVGEAGCMPPTYSLLGDVFYAPAERTRAMAIYWLGSPLSQLLSFIGGGWLYRHVGWRMTFALMGIPALLLAILVKATLTDPRGSLPTASSKHVSVFRIVRLLWAQSCSRHLSIAIVLTLTLSLGLQPWYGAFMIRSHHADIADLSVWMGLIFGVSGVVGTAAGGFAAARWFPDNERAQLRLSALMTGALTPCFVMFLLLPREHEALLALIPLVVVWNIFLGPSFALLQRLVSEEMRATTLSVVMLASNLIGMGIGPQIVGFASDWWRPILGIDSLRYAMLATSLMALWAAYHFWRAGKTVQQDLELVHHFRIPIMSPSQAAAARPS